MPHPVNWFEVHSNDVANAAEWYGRIFGWTITPIDGMDYALVDTGHALGGGITTATHDPDTLVYVEVPDLEQVLERVEASGGKVVVPVTEIPDMVTFAVFADPEGNVMGLTLAQVGATPAEPEPQFALLYEPAPDVMEKAPLHFDAHAARLEEFRRRGDLLQVGTFGAAQPEGSLAVFRTREAAEEFVADDPFRLNDVISGYRITQWNVSY
jgi:predicted enzyme related to lactoylglutathione lyase/uncharacterized protein YciI